MDVYGIYNDLQASAAYNIQQLELKTKSFIKEDFDNLAKVSFPKLRKSTI